MGCLSNPSELLEQDKIELLEEFKVLLLNRANRVVGVVDVSSGGMSGTVVDAKLVFGIALKACAHSIILCHNHPSGNLRPSSSNIALMSSLIKGGLLLDLPIADHLIITEHNYLSLGMKA